MFTCEKCCKEFKYNWCLSRHLSKKIPCRKKSPNESNIPSNESKNIQKSSNESKNIQKSSDESDIPPNESNSIPKMSNESIRCMYCLEDFSRIDNLKKHMNVCKEKDDAVRSLEMQLDIEYLKNISKTCRFCEKHFPHKTNLTRHIKTCKSKQTYRTKLEAQLKERTKETKHITNNNNSHNTTNNLNVNNTIQISASELRKFGDESTAHITDEYLRRAMGRLEVSLAKVVSTVAKQIFCDNTKPGNQTLQITNVRSQWAKVSKGKSYELQPLCEAVSGVRNKVTDLYVERQCDEPDYFKKVNSRIEKLDDLNNQSYTASTLAEKEDQKNASKLKSEIDREIKSTLYNVQKSNTITSKS